jgi:hypothetical protein
VGGDLAQLGVEQKLAATLKPVPLPAERVEEKKS